MPNENNQAMKTPFERFQEATAKILSTPKPATKPKKTRKK